jgi:hypothetical protein
VSNNQLDFLNNHLFISRIKFLNFCFNFLYTVIISEAQVETYSKITYTLKRLIEIRWNCNYDSILAIDETFASLLLALSWLCNSKNSELSVTAKAY